MKDNEVRENLSEVSNHVQAVGRMIGSKTVDKEGLNHLQHALKAHASTIETYISMME